ncbi:hypothetical protein PQQ96_30255, partial [Paraburkholderia sediminicola]|uniref:hypothetical protein n=1 Tax=Paraburkholderia sediminicola TaxID=458836 RepID=UPI0038BB653F
PIGECALEPDIYDGHMHIGRNRLAVWLSLPGRVEIRAGVETPTVAVGRRTKGKNVSGSLRRL